MQGLDDLESRIGFMNLNRAQFRLPLRHEVGDLSRLGSGERNAAKPQAREGRTSGSE